MARIKTATRTLINAGPRRLLYVIPSPKADGVLVAESTVEYECLLHELFDRSVVKVKVQPTTFTFKIDGQEVSYTPDACCVHTDGRMRMREYKASPESLTAEEHARLKHAARFITSRGYDFDVVYASALNVGYRTENIVLLMKYSEWRHTPGLEAKVLSYLNGHEQTCLQDLRDLVGSLHYGSLYRMLYEQNVVADLDGAPLSGDTIVQRGAR